MSVRRFRSGFRLVGRLRPDQMGLPAARGRELLLAHAWARVAGQALARRAVAHRIVRGVLEIEVADERWVETLVQLIPRLAGRLSSSYPQLGVRRFRLLRGSTKPRGRPQPLVQADEPDAVASSPAGPDGPETAVGADEAPSAARVMERYLEAGSHLRGKRARPD